ncbi:MAG TPA: sensor histidine kinase, partial [Bacteroidetes bacterium]|nr:sensor histidine kinase [Bacteroidota bacterium]
YEREKVEKEMALVKKEHERVRLVTLIISLLVLMVLLAGGFFLVLLRRRNQRLIEDKAKQMEFSSQLISWQEEERKRVARELHDGLGQSLSIIKNKVLGMKTEGEKGLALTGIAQSVGKAIQEVRVISQALRPMQLDVLGLRQALEDLVEESLGAGGIDFTSEIGEIDGLLDQNQEVMTYRMVQESMNNILKHAACTFVRVNICVVDGKMKIEISDNGKGFDFKQVWEGKEGGMGFSGMRERVAFSQGEIKVDSVLGKGTDILIQIPIANGE